MNRRRTILWLWMYVNRTCFVDLFATVKKRFVYVWTHTLSLTHSEQAEIQKNNQRELVSFDQIEALIISEESTLVS